MLFAVAITEPKVKLWQSGLAHPWHNAIAATHGGLSAFASCPETGIKHAKESPRMALITQILSIAKEQMATSDMPMSVSELAKKAW